MKLFKKFISLFLVGVLSFNELLPLVLANSINEVATNNEVQEESVKARGNIEVETNLVLPVRNTLDCDITVALYSNDNKKITEVSLKEFKDKIDYIDKVDNDEGIRVTASRKDKEADLITGYNKEIHLVYLATNFYNVERGTYTLELSGTNFVTYRKEVTLDKFSQRISITNEKGMFEIGDVTHDNKVDNDDIKAMLKAINNNDLSKDLNLDGITNIADLNYISAIINNKKQDVKVEDTSAILSTDSVTVEVSESTKVDGNLNNIFVDDGIVTLEKTGDKNIELSLDLAKDSEDAIKMEEVRINFGTDNVPKAGYIEVDDAKGEQLRFDIPLESEVSTVHKFTENNVEGTRVIDLKGQIAVKKVTIVITDTGSNKLADIAKVEFLNNVKVEIEEPDDLYVPRNVQVDASVSEQLTVTFNDTSNVTGYEIRIKDKDKDKETIYQTTFKTFTIEDLKNYVTYKVAVRSVHGEWVSNWSDEVDGIPQASRVPPAPNMVTATGTYGGIDFTWKPMDDTTSYNLYYKEVGASEFIKVEEKIKDRKYSLRGLKSGVEYVAYVTGNNVLGEGAASHQVTAKTLQSAATIYPKYRLINEYDGTLNRTNHIKDVKYSIGTSYEVNASNDVVESDKWSMVDDNYQSYWEYYNWQMNASAGYNINVPIFVLDKTYTMDEFVLTVPTGFKNSYKTGTYDENSQSKNDTLLYYWNDDNITSDNKTIVRGVLTKKLDENKQPYYVLKLQKPIKASAIQFGITVVGNGQPIDIAEVKFYEYDSLVDDVAKLFKDDLRVELNEDVNQNKIDELRARANEKHNNEYNPYRESILNDLKYAEDLLNDKQVNDVIVLNPNISNTYNNHLGFAMTISDYQPLGVAVRAGEQITIYVGSTGDAPVEAVFTQNHAEANSWSSKVALKKGQNVITVPTIGNATTERGGSVYIRYTGKPNTNNLIKVRVSGGVKIPMLDTTLTEGNEIETKKAIQNYIESLDTYVAGLKDLYNDIYKEEETQYSYDKYSSALGVTEIVTTHGLWSFQAEAVKEALDAGTSSLSERVERLYESTEAFDEMMLMFYRHKGLEANATDSKNEMPKARINIRYMQMFDGAFMYAGGYHVGIEYSSIPGVIQGKRNTQNKTGYFGWGISHEVGHQINQGNIVYAEVTNNVYSLLAQTSNDKDLSRLEVSNIYDKIYDKVTSHTLGRAQNVFVTLGMYWQLHLAYDNNYTFTDTNSIFTRINEESRHFDNTKTKYSEDDLLILFASKAANKDLTDYFEVWGIKASSALKKEIESLKLEKETKPIYYLNDAARRYRLNNGTEIADTTKLTASVTNKDNANKRISLSFNVNAEDNKILGYEILRNGESIAFVPGNTHTFIDNIGSVNNRAFTYEVVAYNYLLNATNKVTLDEIKVEHDGKVQKDTFTIESNFKEKGEIVDLEDDNLDYNKLKVSNLIDGNDNTVFNGSERIKTLNSSNSKVSMNEDTNDAYIIINLNTKLSLCGIRYKGLLKDGLLDSNTIRNYKISISSDKTNWTLVKTGTFELINSNHDETVYFVKPDADSIDQLETYHDISYIKIESVGNKKGISGAEIDLIAPPGDNINFTMNDGQASIGKLTEDYCYLTSGCDYSVKDANGDVEGVIPKGSVVFEGVYAGSPSFNVLKIANANNEEEVYSGYQLIFAHINSDLTVYDVANGIWLYVMSQEEYENMLSKTTSIRANLYRVSNSVTMKGERLTSSTLKVNLKPYSELEAITITGNAKQ